MTQDDDAVCSLTVSDFSEANLAFVFRISDNIRANRLLSWIPTTYGQFIVTVGIVSERPLLSSSLKSDADF